MWVGMLGHVRGDFMTQPMVKSGVAASAGIVLAAALSLTAFGSGGRKNDLAPAPATVRDMGTCAGRACAPGALASPAYCDGSLRCVLAEAGLGQACASHTDCQAPLVCPWATHVCSTPAKVGQPCHSNPGGRSECASGAGCNGIRCVVRKPEGQACMTDEECRSGDCQGGRCSRGGELSMLPAGFATE